MPIASQLCTRKWAAATWRASSTHGPIYAFLDKLSRDWPQSRIDELLPQQWKAARAA